MSRTSHKSEESDLPADEALSEHSLREVNKAKVSPRWNADLSVWLVCAALMLIGIAILPFAVRNQNVVKAIARMCGFDLQ